MVRHELQVDPKSLIVDIGMPVHSPSLPFPTAASLFDTAKLCENSGIKSRLVSPVGCSIVTDARSAVVDEFLKGDATHLFWIDSDIFWHPHAFARLLVLSTEVGVVGATYPLKMDPIKFMVRDLGPRMEQYGLVEVSGLGLGFCAMRRDVVERVAADTPEPPAVVPLTRYFVARLKTASSPIHEAAACSGSFASPTSTKLSVGKLSGRNRFEYHR